MSKFIDGFKQAFSTGRNQKSIIGNPALVDYIDSVSVREPEVLRRLRKETSRLVNGGMAISPNQGQYLALMLELIGAKKTIEVGVFTGYSTLWTALALPRDGRIVACDVSEEWTSIARYYWAEANVSRKIDLRLAPASETLHEMIVDGEQGQYDFAFIDADKGNYDRYYELCLQLVRPGGLIAIDNVLWGGAVADSRRNSPDTEAIRELNAKLHVDKRVSICLVPIGDGLTLLRKKEEGLSF